MVLAVAVLSVLTQALSAAELGYDGLTLRTTQDQLLERFPRWRSIGRLAGPGGEYSIASDVKDRRGVDYIEARLRRGKIQALSLLINGSCKRLVAVLVAAYGRPAEINRFEEDGRLNETRVWDSRDARLTVTCPVSSRE